VSAAALPPPASRNAPCPCGSGQRYKDCHGALGGPAATSVASDDAAAEAAWRQLLAREPDHPEALFHLGNRHRERGEYAAAIDGYERALRRAPGHPGVLNNLGLALEVTGQNARAEACYRDVLARESDHADALANLANVLFQREAIEEAAAIYDRLFALRHDLPASLWIRRAIAQDRLRNFGEAEASFRAAATLAPYDLQIHVDFGTFYVRRGRFADAEPVLRRVLELDPGNPYARVLLAHSRQQQCAWVGLSEAFANIGRLLDAESRPTIFPVPPFYTLAMPLSPRAQLRAAQRWAETIVPEQRPPRPLLNVAPGERLRVAFVTANFRDHPTLHLSLEFWEKLDRTRLELYAYSLRRADANPYLRRAQAAFEHFIDVSGESVGEIAQRIREDRIAILIDRNGYTLNAREGIFALRPAPIQINCIGYPGTLGAPWYDYIFSDRFSLPEHLLPFYSERPLYMPHMAFPSDTTRLPAEAPPLRAECGLPETGFVFCCFNNAYKILPEVFAIWMRLLAAVPGSVLWLLATSAEATANLRREAQGAGIDPTRLIFAPRVSVGEHVARNAAADLFLDTYPYGAHTTANDALLAGLPLITRVGDTLVSRIAGSQLAAIGLPELITASFAAYEALALKLATEPALLQRYRDRLAANRHTTPLFAMRAYARDFADAMARIWAEHAVAQP
jgi:predicted O-linked N-acetylglucosamine transferase (SPINDLY family)